MKILIVVPDTTVGGVTTSAVNFSCELAKHGHEIIFLDMSDEFQCADSLTDTVKTVTLYGRSSWWNIGAADFKRTSGIKKIGIMLLGVLKKLTIRSGLWYRLIFSKFGKGECFDVAVAFRQCAPCYSFVLNKVNAKKKIGFVHGELTYMGDISSWKKYMTSFDKIAYVSNAVREAFVVAHPELRDNATTIYNMFNVDRIKDLSEKPSAIDFDKGCENLVTVARLTMQKQIDWILYACSELKSQIKTPFHWYIVGDGYLREKLESLAASLGVEDVVTFTGSLSNPYPLIKNASFTVLPSLWEAYGMVVIESFILKKPIVVAEYDALKEIMNDGEYGLITKQSVESLVACVKDILEDRDGIRTKCQNRLKEYNYTNTIAYHQFIDAVE